jgi:hypothetical protein
VIAVPVVFRNSRRSIAMVATFDLEALLHAAYYILRRDFAQVPGRARSDCEEGKPKREKMGEMGWRVAK